MTWRIETVDRLDAAQRQDVDALIRRATASDGVPPVGEHKYLKLHAGETGACALLAFADHQLEGYAQVLVSADDATAEIVVDPSRRGQGLGRRLLATARAVSRRAGGASLKVWAYGALPVSGAIAARHGITPSRTLLQLERPLDELDSTALPAGYAIRTFDPSRDRAAWLHLHNEVFADHPENGKWAAGDLESRLQQPWFEADDFLVAEREGRMVGFNWLKRVPDAPPQRPEGEIYIIGVAGSERGRGLGRALAVLGLHHLRAEGMRVCTLYVEGDNTPALSLYNGLGFRVRHTHRCYTLPLLAKAGELSAEQAGSPQPSASTSAHPPIAAPAPGPALAPCS
ncbi:MAG: mycothiol synthase [Chloroflexi bacterium]|nr:mycothiol synthase [Chloroflexota bacterium]